jgi:hypothetical protein
MINYNQPPKQETTVTVEENGIKYSVVTRGNYGPRDPKPLVPRDPKPLIPRDPK